MLSWVLRTQRKVPIADFFVLPADRLDTETVLAPGELVAAVEITEPRAVERDDAERARLLGGAE